MKQESIELVIIFEGGLINVNDLIKYFESVHYNLDGANFQELSYSIMVKSYLKSKSLKFTKLNIQKLHRENPVNGFSLTSLLPDWKYKSTDIKFSVSYTPQFNPRNSSLTITLNKAKFYYNDSKNLIELYLGFVSYLISFQATITYGFIFSMPNYKFPGLYAAGIGNYDLTPEEEINLQLWAEKNNDCDLKIWNIFWGNLVTKNHLRPTQNQSTFKLWDILSGTYTTKNDSPLVQKIKPILGKSNVYSIDNNTCFFTMPGNDLLLGNEDERKKNALFKLFNKLTFKS